MSTVTATHALVRDALLEAGVHAVDGPADDLPVDPDTGLVGQAAVLWAHPGWHQYTRSSGTRSGREDRVTVICVGATRNDALAVADKVEAAVGGMRLSGRGGTLRQSVATQPVAEPNSDPRRVSLAVEYVVITKGLTS